MMVKFIIFCFLSFVQDGWVAYSPEDGMFTIQIPKEITWVKTTNSTLSSIGPLELIMYKSKDKDAYHNSYMLSYVDYSGIVELENEARDSIIQETVAGLPGELIYQQEIPTGQFDGKLIRKKLPNQGLHMKSKVFFQGTRLYIMIVYVSEEKSMNPRIDHFLDSIRLS